MKKNWFVWMKQRIFSAKLNSQVNFLFAVILIAYTLSLVVFFMVSGRKTVKEYVSKASEDVLISVGGSINSNFDNMNTMSRMIMFSEEVNAYLTDQGSPEYQKNTQAVKKMYGIVNDFSYNVSVYVFRNDGNYINISGDRSLVHTEILEDSEWRKELERNAGANTIQINGNGLFSNISGEKLISFVRIINDPDTQQEIGIIAINYSADDLEKEFQDFLTEENSLSVADIDGNYLCGNKDIMESDDVKEILDEESGKSFSRLINNTFIRGYVVPDTPIQLIKCDLLSYNIYLQEAPWMFIIMLVFLTILCIIAIRVFITLYVTRPIEKLVESMKKVESGWLYRVSADIRTEEIRNLKDNYNQMLVQINHLISEVVEKEKIAQQAKMEVILEQINPHFLYNTLETIGYMAFESPREKIYEAVESLGEFYRNFLIQDQDKVNLRTEIIIVKNYLKIQKFRYGEIFNDVYCIENECSRCLVPKLILQPLVENALYHGVRPKGEKGEIRITAHKSDDMLVLSVYDSGVGISREKLKKVLEQEKKGFGLKKTLERVRCMYDAENLYIIESEEGRFFEITFKIPFEEEVKYVQSNDNR